MNTEKITLAYLECAAWAEELSGEFTKEAKKKAEQDVAKFCADNEENILDFMTQNSVDETQVGHSFYLSRNGHGAGFFDFWSDSATLLQHSAADFGASQAIKSGRYISFI